MNKSHAFRCIPVLVSALVFSLFGCGDESTTATNPPEKKERYNVLLISLDTLRVDHVGAYGYDRPVSPKIDRFAEKAIRFDRAYSHAPWTTPSHASLLTSLYPSALGLKKYPETGTISERVETMAEYFKSQGYLTQAVTEGGMVHAQFGFAQGFDYYFQSARHVDHGVEAAVKWLDQYGHHPFFFFFHTYDIHRYDPPDEYRNLFVTQKDHPLAKDEDLAKKIQNYDNSEFIKGLDEADLKYIIDLYDASIRWVDHYVAELLAYLQERDLLDRTIVVITSDHGEEFLERSRTGHGYSNFEEQIHVPLIVFHPDLTPGSRSTLFRHIDVLPTLADALDMPVRREWLGESLWPVMKNGDDKTRLNTRLNFCECGHSDYRSIQSSRWKLIDNKAPRSTSLYNLEKDPDEKSEVGEENPKVKRTLSQLLQQIETLNKKLSPQFAGDSVGTDELPEDLLNQLQELGYTSK